MFGSSEGLFFLATQSWLLSGVEAQGPAEHKRREPHELEEPCNNLPQPQLRPEGRGFASTVCGGQACEGLAYELEVLRLQIAALAQSLAGDLSLRLLSWAG